MYDDIEFLKILANALKEGHIEDQNTIRISVELRDVVVDRLTDIVYHWENKFTGGVIVMEPNFESDKIINNIKEESMLDRTAIAEETLKVNKELLQVNIRIAEALESIQQTIAFRL